MDMKNAKQIWDTLNEFYQNDKEGYEQFMKKHMNKIKDVQPIKPKFCLCVVADFEQVTIKTKVNHYKEKICNYYIYVYHTDKMKKPILPNDVIHNIEKVDPSNLYISTNKIKGENNKDMYAEAIIHSILWKYMDNKVIKHKVVTIILELMNSLEKSLREHVSINTNHFEYVKLDYTPKTKHFLNPHCVDSAEVESKEENEVDKTDLKFYKILNEKWKEEKQEETKETDHKEIKLFNSSNMILKDLHVVKTEKKKCDTKNDKIQIPKQVKSYYYKIVDRYLHILLEFSSVSYNDLEILKMNNQIDIYVSAKYSDVMSLKFKESLSNNVRAYFNEKLMKLTISIELLS